LRKERDDAMYKLDRLEEQFYKAKTTWKKAENNYEIKMKELKTKLEESNQLITNHEKAQEEVLKLRKQMVMLKGSINKVEQ
jgi:hypothetical protein